MSVKKDASGRRSIQVEVEVPGTPEEVWQAIATGPGVTSWFVPTEEQEDGTVVSHFGPGMDAVASKTAWDPPHRFAAESDGFGPGSPPMATEWIVEARAGGTCVVRVVHSLFADNDDWDKQLQSIESGWPVFFLVLKSYLTHFPGQTGSNMQLIGFGSKPVSQVWDKLVGTLGLSGAVVGGRWSTPAGVPPLAGVVERDGEEKYPHLLMLRLDQPTPGIAFLLGHTMGDQVILEIRFYLYGNRAAGIAAHDEPLWQAWLSEHFPAPDGAGPCA